jgi:5-methylcytosine-specific restriction endonuclease McrA
MVYIISKSGRPLMPTKNHAKVRILLKQNKAKVVQTKPYFVIKLLYETTEYYQTLYLGWDLGSIHNGLAVADKKGNIYYKGQLILRGNLKQLSATRRGHRSFRRCKLWDRPKRFKLRRNSIRKDRYSPTMVMKHRQCMEMYKELSNVMPIKEENIIMETSQFDTHLLAHPEDTNRNGINYGFANSRAYVLHRDGYRCRHCGKSINNKLEVHHIVPKNNNGSDFHQNLITFCVDCHQDLHDGKWQLNQKGLARNYLAI